MTSEFCVVLLVYAKTSLAYQKAEEEDTFVQS